MIKEAIYQEQITVVIIYTPNIGAPNFINQTQLDMKRQIDLSIIIVSDFNILLTQRDRTIRKYTDKQTSKLTYNIDWMDLIDIYSVLNAATEEYTFFSATKRNFSIMYGILGHKARLGK